MPADLRQALAAAPLAEAAWRDLTPISRRDFMSWINEAKQAETRSRRIERCCENLAAGKRRPCCYAVVPMDLYKALGAAPVIDGKGAKAQWSDLTANEKRDFSDWVEAAKERETRKGRIEEACAMLAAGKRSP
ncbi:MAG: YdeI/OmpD-associated family protein [Fimbriimonas ginsengisoli]|uniref:YdeI/OmpD-associated family protein n=1 Tax=Fimbriimonas ginsengisoli TaxID=1005039 RepID=A0A931LVG7_FIMGI|nr:YdeI/OmpD-associated family protein [Fimbriimonas ginsengisoli]